MAKVIAMSSGSAFKRQAFEKLYRFFDLPRYVRLTTVNFSRPWWLTIWQQRGLFLLVIANEILFQAWDALIPIMIAYAIEQQSLLLLAAILTGWALIAVINYAAMKLNTKFQVQIIFSVFYSAHRHLLEADPLEHTTKSTGTVLAKIERAARAYEEMLDILTFEILPVIITCITIVAMLTTLNKLFAFGVGVGLIVVACWSTFGYIFAAQVVTPRRIALEDAAKAAAVENLTQHTLIRSCFASKESDARLKKLTETTMYAEGTGWRTGHIVNLISRLLYYSLFGTIVLYLITCITNGTMSALLGTSIIISFLRSTQEIIRVGRRFYLYAKQLRIIQDMSSFMRSFTHNSFPVLTGQQACPVLKESDALSVVTTDLTFQYPRQAELFNEHQFSLQVDRSDSNKLYGIIGPSGTGKSTFISILGGQLKPLTGTVKINGIDIYAVDDTIRRQLIGLQQQTASSMRGTIRQSLVFGLPTEHQCYTDEQLMQVLINVGLWQILDAKQGLDTFIGESGLTLSGGQRQRLNFASLYLRARYYRPVLILIDEPTSSLDRVSELAITTMIQELARSAIVLVIAHRLDTIASAAGLIDFSLLASHKKITVCQATELEQISPYYKHLIHIQ
ncbi:ABC transporter ATP-binding protein/permease [Candidatus Dependentiae bacterium]|nr:ABC transporter ATP-binding protein/permease [Candidatus Dependentiae bacterium]